MADKWLVRIPLRRVIAATDCNAHGAVTRGGIAIDCCGWQNAISDGVTVLAMPVRLSAALSQKETVSPIACGGHLHRWQFQPDFLTHQKCPPPSSTVRHWPCRQQAAQPSAPAVHHHTRQQPRWFWPMVWRVRQISEYGLLIGLTWLITVKARIADGGYLGHIWWQRWKSHGLCFTAAIVCGAWGTECVFCVPDAGIPCWMHL